MSEFRVDQIKNQAGTRGPDIAGITTFSGVSGLLMPSGDAPVESVLTGRLSIDFSTWSGVTTTRAAVTTSAAIAPDGTQTADEISNADNSLNFHNIFIYYSNFDTQASYIGEVFFKRVSSITTQYVTMYIDGLEPNPSYIIFNLKTGNVEIEDSYFSSTTQYQIDDAGNGWYRCAVLIKTVSNAYRPFSFWPTPINVKEVNASFTGDTTTGRVYAWRPILYRVDSNRPISEVISNINLRTKITPGAIRFNTDSMKLEYYRGGPVGFGTTTTTGEWVNVSTDSPDIQTGGTRGLFGGGYTFPSPTTNYNTIDYITVSSTGNAITFGELIGAIRRSTSACSSRTRGLWGGGNNEPSTNSNQIDFVTITSTGNATDFGDLTVARRGTAAVSSSTRGVWAGGRTPTQQTVMDYVTIASAGDAKSFGDLSRSTSLVNTIPAQSSTRGLFGGGYGPVTNIIEFITISTLGNGADFGDLTVARNSGGGCSNSIRALFGGGYTFNIIDYVTIATLGNAIDFGDLLYSSSQISACSSPTRAVWAGGYVSPAATDNINYQQIMSTGNAVDFGNLTVARAIRNAGCSNGHGGLG